ncbi:glycosidase [Sphingobium indicum]|uniref:glycoside hydrolase family 130 protein n=1 Tax=Sphingobium indicum TaxID=332055 RepID=UPI002687C053
MINHSLVREIGPTLRADPSRVVIRPFVPGDDPTVPDPALRSRIGRIIERIVTLDAQTCRSELERILASLAGRHGDVEQVLLRRCNDLVCPPAIPSPGLTKDQMLLIGAYMSAEYSYESAALFNPSIVPHPEAAKVAGASRFLLSLRAVGEGHLSSITFRTGHFDGSHVELDPVSAISTPPRVKPLPGGEADDPGVRLTCGSFPDISSLVIFPVTFRQRHGLEDLRLTRFEEENGYSFYLGTYTAAGGETVRQELLRTTDFQSFELSALRTEVSDTKGIAIFPRRIAGHYAALARLDHESIWLLRSNDIYNWTDGAIILRPCFPWEFVQLGNCGSPIELDEGWLVITHGVGPVRDYSLGACLLDKENPARVLGRSTSPLITTDPKDRDGYVPNVVYSCGALLHERTLLLPLSSPTLSSASPLSTSIGCWPHSAEA